MQQVKNEKRKFHRIQELGGESMRDQTRVVKKTTTRKHPLELAKSGRYDTEQSNFN